MVPCAVSRMTLRPGQRRLQFLQQPDAVELIHAQVRDHQIRPEARGGGERLHAILHRFDVVVLGAQPNGQQAQQSRIVVHDQDAGFAFGGLIHGWRPSLADLRSVRLRSMLAMASSLACASSSCLRSARFRPFPPADGAGSRHCARDRRVCASICKSLVLGLQLEFAVDLRQLDQRHRAFDRHQRLGLRRQLAQQRLRESWDRGPGWPGVASSSA